jgi:DNA modification methylase
VSAAKGEGALPACQAVSVRIERIGLATLYLGDCRDVQVERDAAQMHAVLMDPPYSSGGFQESGKTAGSIGTRQNDVIALDNLSSRGYQRLIGATMRRFRWAEEAYIFTDWKMWTHTADALEEGGFRVRNMLVWDKEQMGMGMPWRNQHELIAFGKRNAASLMSGKFGNVLRCPRSGNVHHPTEKPAGLIRALVENSQSAVFIDPFMGSGTTGVAATSLGRGFIGIEIDPRHFATACRRIEQAQRQGDLFRDEVA